MPARRLSFPAAIFGQARRRAAASSLPRYDHRMHTSTKAAVNGIEIDYQIYGPANGKPLLLIMGLATQRTAWPEAWIEAFVARGFKVITFDNRDVGLSTRFNEHPTPSPMSAFLRRRLHLPVKLAYELRDMAADANALLEYLHIAHAVVLGVSMGGMVAQRMALAYPERVERLILLMTSSGRPWLPLPSPRVLKILLSRPVGQEQQEAAVDYLVRLFGLIGSPGYPIKPEQHLQRARTQVERSMAGTGAARQLAAIVADDQRWRELGKICVPTRVIHGIPDLMVPIRHGHDLAKRIPGASFEAVPGLGHDLPEQLAEFIAERVASV